MEDMEGRQAGVPAHGWVAGRWRGSFNLQASVAWERLNQGVETPQEIRRVNAVRAASSPGVTQTLGLGRDEAGGELSQRQGHGMWVLKATL